MSSREPNQVPLSFEDDERLTQNRVGIVDLLAAPPGIEDVEFEVQSSLDVARPARFD